MALSLDDVDAELLETEEAIQRLEEQLQGLREPPPAVQEIAGPKAEAERLPGRWCRAGHVPDWRPAPRGGKSSKAKGSKGPSTFGAGSRFSSPQELQGDFLLNPTDDFLSNRPVLKAAKIYSDSVKPRQIWEAKRWLQTLAEHQKCKEASDILQSGGSLAEVTAAWQALLADEASNVLDDASTDAGSELSELLSVSSASTAPSLPPGPGSYSPNYEVLRPNLAKGAPSFSRYSAREGKHDKDEPEIADEPESSVSMLGGSDPTSSGFTCPGGKILPPHTTRPRRPTTSQLDAVCFALRPLGPVAEAAEELKPDVLQETEAPPDWSRHPGTGRLDRLETGKEPGPGDYDLPVLPGGPTPIIAAPLFETVKEEVVEPGPAEYDLRASEAFIYPRIPGGQFGARPGVMEHQQHPDYIANYDALELNFDQVEQRAPNALILPEESEEALRALQIMKHRAPAAGTGARVGPGTYREEDALVQRLRPDRMVLPWHPRREGVAEHLVGLHKHYTRFGRWRLDDRALMGADDDVALRRNRPRAFIQPPHQPPLKRSWSAEDIWRLYLPKLDEPQSRNFARNLDFDEWQEKEKHWRWLAVRQFFRTRPSLRLSYSLPDLELVKDRAPEVDFSKAPGRSPRSMEEEEVEGDILLLHTAAAPDLRYPRAPAVDMSKQLGRDSNDLVDDFEELVLSPKRPERRASCFVDMAKEPGRPAEPAWDPHIWAEEPDRVFCYQPTTSFETEDVLDLSPAAVQRRLQRRVPSYDWARCMGRPGHDLRMSPEEEEASVLLTNWEAPFIAPPRPPVLGTTHDAGSLDADIAPQPPLEPPEVVVP